MSVGFLHTTVSSYKGSCDDLDTGQVWRVSMVIYVFDLFLGYVQPSHDFRVFTMHSIKCKNSQVSGII
jgi:hypothetical protein